MKRIAITIVTLAGIAGFIGLLAYHPRGSDLGTSTSGSSSGAKVTYKDGSYTGNTVDVGYGPIQVQAVVSGGKIAAVNLLQMPTDLSQSQMIASAAKPQLIQEAIASQTANVDTVSGATSDSEGFVQSLQSALTKASS